MNEHLAKLLFVLSTAALTTSTANAVITSDTSGSHQTTPGVQVMGINHDGVGLLLFDLSDDIGRCTGALLEGGRHVLTAAHCVERGEAILGARIRFELATGEVFLPVTSWIAHPEFGINSSGLVGGNDVAVLTLASTAPDTIPQYEIYRNLGGEFNVPIVRIGYGRTGHGATGDLLAAGTKRWGLNEYEVTSANTNVNTMVVGGDDAHTWLNYDFDSGLPANDAFQVHLGAPQDLGFFGDEVSSAPVDSGGPIFIDDNGVYRIAGIVSAGARFPGTPNADVDNDLNSTWGQFGRDTRVAAPENMQFILAAIPEPSTAITLSMGLATLVVIARCRRLY